MYNQKLIIEEANKILDILFKDITKKNVVDMINVISKGVANDTANVIYNHILKSGGKKESLEWIKRNWEVYKKAETRSPINMC